ncbi:alcohol acyltransferase 9 [Cannabis sativa]|uniref:alcohol acyltransferase 9 n=1 Tax=Cannabis sativa TaxID=3483 RepID=UPI0029CA5F1E|nr:alcohol acyltransferase 9 [Cannabis sativa]
MGSSHERVKEAVVVTPSEATPTCVLPLSAIDSQPFLRFTIEYLLIYKPSTRLGLEHDGSTLACLLKSALSKALVPYYPLAGRVRTRPDGSGQLEVVCREQGAVFIEAVSDRTISDFTNKAPRHVTQWKKLLSVHVSDVLKGAPPLVVQLTLLKDGGAALGVGFNHCLIDGIGSAEFLNLFAELANRRVKSRPEPVWERNLLDPKPGKGIPSSTSSFVTLPEFNSVPDISGFVTRFSSERLTPTTVTFDRTSLVELKNIAQSTRLTYSTTFTSFEVLSAHVWRSWARALNLPPNQTLKLLFSINVRGRVRPNLPSGYYGNAFVLGCAQTNAKDLEEMGLWYAAGLVKAAKDRVGDEHVRAVIESVSESRACPDSVGVLIVSQWSRLGLEKVDFGLGKPAHVGPICCDRYCLFLPVPNQREAVKVMVAVPASAVDKYDYLIRNHYT